MPETHALRRARLARLVAERGADAALITRLVNVRYLTGLAASNAALLVPADGTATLATDGRYLGTARRVAPDLACVVDRSAAPALLSGLNDSGTRLVAFEAHAVTVEELADLTELTGQVGGKDGGVRLVPLGHAVEELRTVKDEAEIALVREACAITDRAFEIVLPMVRAGVTERAVAVALERAMVDLGAERPAFDSIVASGPNGAIPHHEPGERVIETGDLVTMDFGARYGGYHADMTRTVAVGAVDGWQREIYELVAAAQRAGVAAARRDAAVADVDAAARDLIGAAGHGEHFPHGLGHGVGLEIHEAPHLGHGKTGKLQDRVPITVEPGVYLADRGGVRIEDTLVVRAGAPELLTQTTKDLLVL
jgi:Xaa-Pro aminopeptidase